MNMLVEMIILRGRKAFCVRYAVISPKTTNVLYPYKRLYKQKYDGCNFSFASRQFFTRQMGKNEKMLVGGDGVGVGNKETFPWIFVLTALTPFHPAIAISQVPSYPLLFRLF